MKGAENRLARHTPVWDVEYNAEKVRLLQLLQNELAELQHIGTTAIRGILAVPVYDIAVGLKPEAGIPAAFARLKSAGYDLLPPDVSGYVRFVRRNAEGEEKFCLWVTYAGTPAWNDLLAFRNYLNNHVFAANEYETLRRRFAEDPEADGSDYAVSKAQFIRKILRLSVTDACLGERVTVQVERPLGSRHPDHPELVYELNYGFVPGMTGGDGEPQDAYIYGVPRPVRQVTGTVIAVVHRKNDTEDKLIVAPSGTIAYEPQLTAAVRFVEQYFDTLIICIYEKSCGAIIYRKRPGGVIEYLIVLQSKSGTWSIPKGHIDSGETERETALREIYEETGLRVALIDGFRREMTYTVSAKASKNLVIFLAEADGEVVCRENEIGDYLWADKDTAIKRLGGRSIGHVLEAADAYIRSGRKKPFGRR